MDRNEKILNCVKEHYEEVSGKYDLIGVFLQGSQNYNLDYEKSDVDTKAVIVPSLKDIALNNQQISTTYVRENNEHIDLKDFRLMIKCFKKQNINFIEILFTKFFILSNYQKEWNKLVNAREYIARYNIFQAISTMAGTAYNKYKLIEHVSPSSKKLIEEYGYDTKQLHHLIRILDFLKRYIDGKKYEDCLVSPNNDILLEIKKGCLNIDDARIIAEQSIKTIDLIVNNFKENNENSINNDIDKLFEEVTINIIKESSYKW